MTENISSINSDVIIVRVKQIIKELLVFSGEITLTRMHIVHAQLKKYKSFLHTFLNYPSDLKECILSSKISKGKKLLRQIGNIIIGIM